MHRSLLSLLVCPGCASDLKLVESVSTSSCVKSGTLVCQSCERSFAIRNGVPRFVDEDPYAASFGLQWTTFRTQQLDSVNGFKLSESRFLTETGWSSESIRGALVLDVGCGAGRFLDVVSNAGARVVGVDLSAAVDAAQSSLGKRDNVDIVQADIADLPFRRGAFDAAYCIGVLQHTPNPSSALHKFVHCVRPEGRVAITVYPRRPWTRFYPKYLLRPFTRRMRSETLLRVIKVLMPPLFLLSEVTFRLPLLGKVAGSSSRSRTMSERMSVGTPAFLCDSAINGRLWILSICLRLATILRRPNRRCGWPCTTPE